MAKVNIVNLPCLQKLSNSHGYLYHYPHPPRNKIAIVDCGNQKNWINGVLFDQTQWWKNDDPIEVNRIQGCRSIYRSCDCSRYSRIRMACSLPRYSRSTVYVFVSSCTNQYMYTSFNSIGNDCSQSEFYSRKNSSQDSPLDAITKGSRISTKAHHSY